jgi:hypothetical protein
LVRVLVRVEDAAAARRVLAESVGLPEDAEELPGPHDRIEEPHS